MEKKKTGILALLLVFVLQLQAFAQSPVIVVPAAADEDPAGGPGAQAALAAEHTAPSEGSVVIYHTNDTHGYLNGSDSVVGIDKVAALKKNTPNSLLVDAGDATQGLPLASLTKGADVMELMNQAGYDLMAVGNHEFDFGTENALANARIAQFPFLAANVSKDGKKLFQGIGNSGTGCHKVFDMDGIRVGFFGLTTRQTKTATNPVLVGDVTFGDEIEAAKREIDELRAEQADVIIAVCHMGSGDAPCTSGMLADAMTGDYQGALDIIIDGHSHTVENIVENDVLIAQTGNNFASVGKLTVTFAGGEMAASEELIGAEELASLEGDSTVAADLALVEQTQEDLLNQQIGTTDVTLWAGSIGNMIPTRFVETNYGDLAADAFRAAGEEFLRSEGRVQTVIAVENGGGIREAVANGVITEGSLISTFPFSNTLYLKEITPKTLYEMMEVSGSRLDGIDPQTGMLLQEKISGGFLQVSGFRVVFDPNASEQHVVSITLDGEGAPLSRTDDTTKLMLAGHNFIMSGGNDYTMLAELPKHGEIGGELETVRGYVISCLKDGVLQGYRTTDSRIVFAGGYSPKDYDAHIRVTDADGTPLADTAVSYKLDGGAVVSGMTDAYGLLTVRVSDGAHSVRLSDSQKDVYIDNYAGLGLVEDTLRSYPTLTNP